MCYFINFKHGITAGYCSSLGWFAYMDLGVLIYTFMRDFNDAFICFVCRALLCVFVSHHDDSLNHDGSSCFIMMSHREHHDDSS